MDNQPESIKKMIDNINSQIEEENKKENPDKKKLADLMLEALDASMYRTALMNMNKNNGFGF